MSKRRLEAACPECGSDMVLRDSRFGLFYGCVRYPACDATHGAHPNGDPLGVPANKETKQARMAAHDSFDQLWKGATKKGRKTARKEAYAWLREQLDLTKEECHIGKFDKRLCTLAIKLLESGERPDLAHMEKKIRKRERRKTRGARLRENTLDGKSKKFDARTLRSEDVSRLLDPRSETDGERLED